MTSTDRVLITGVDTRLGAAVRDYFTERGALTVGTVTAERDSGPDGEAALTVDPVDRAQVRNAVAKAAAQMGGIDVLVVAHGLPVVAPLTEQPMTEFWGHVDATLTGSFLYAQAAADHMRHSGTGGRIVLTTSRWHVGGDGLAAVATAAGGIVALTKSLTRDFGGYGVGVNAVALGALDSEWSVCDGAAGLPPGGRVGSVYQAAAVIGLLSQRQLGAAVGQIVNVDGGLSRNRV
ncbi:NAD(P)-dependent dehydrogenase (short-subunit alcohol dehydrogenase family) [Mycobacterium frederiksbergense]|uniref:3-oxoacyl-[acyl-carrier-protein] reductase MabA n=1 Tax=Mycolicibacterium frederiksbergense TaxID=117567 RepID=A0ABT6KXC0_9MYCO|nr:SDR family oxidoreductase [Mycolicibacterium frederiksbergense]MDH6194911.1 NAD(P)-dependent dehydrogenase (short-subunit alcohol dehydrogenase family) [Mycolicibacterium frederiksbergense]